MITLKSLSDSLVNKTATNKLSFVRLAKTQMFEPKICYKTYLNFSLQKRKRLLDIIRSDDSWTRKNDGIHYTNLYAHHTEWFLHEEYEEFKELTNMIEIYLANSILQVPFKYETKECWVEYTVKMIMQKNIITLHIFGLGLITHLHQRVQLP